MIKLQATQKRKLPVVTRLPHHLLMTIKNLGKLLQEMRTEYPRQHLFLLPNLAQETQALPRYQHLPLLPVQLHPQLQRLKFLQLQRLDQPQRETHFKK
jgi:hypothetical protein